MPSKSTGNIRVGIGGWTFEPWRGTFYPEDLPQKRELEYAGQHLTAIEVNGTYYGSQKPESFARCISFFTAMTAVRLSAWPELWPSPCPGAPSMIGS